MDRVQKMIDGLTKLDTSQSITAVVTEREKELVKMNTDQLLAGKDNTGSQLSPPYALSTQRHKKSGARPVTLKDKGGFHASFFVGKGKTDVEFTAAPNEKNRGFALRDHLKKIYGKGLFGLVAVNFKRLQNLCKERIIKDIRKAIQ
jgi:hypothetical protein